MKSNKFKSLLESINSIDSPELRNAIKAGFDICFESIRYTESSNENDLWIDPPAVDASVEEIYQWINDKIDDDSLINNIIGTGASRTILANDKNTVFKYNAVEYSDVGNQITREILIYNNYPEYHDILPVIYSYGNNWMIEELLRDCKSSDLNKYIGGYSALFAGMSQIDEMIRRYNIESMDLLHRHIATNHKIKQHFPDKDIVNTHDLERIIKTPLERIVDFLITTKTDPSELRLDNLGVDSKGNIKILDFGI